MLCFSNRNVSISVSYMLYPKIWIICLPGSIYSLVITIFLGSNSTINDCPKRPLFSVCLLSVSKHVLEYDKVFVLHLFSTDDHESD